MSRRGFEKDGLYFLPLGGSSEIGMNLNLYCCGGKWLMVDLGLTFADGAYPGVDLIVPDPRFIEERRDDLLGIVLTHAHEDHIGAVPYLWSLLKAPMYATPFTARMIRGKLAEAGLLEEAEINEVALGGSLRLGDFKITYVALAHSIAEGNGLKIETPYGTLFHTGDWKLDDAPQVGKPTPGPELAKIGEQGVLAMIGDSTNVFNQKASGSEGAVYESLLEIIAGEENRVLVTTFASNIARLQTIGRIATRLGRHLALLGRSMQRVVEAARATGYLGDFPTPIPEENIMDLPRDKILLLTTGCQGEPRAALSRIVEGQFKRAALEEGDTVIFASKIIPGNEISIGTLVNRLVLQDIKVITEKDEFVHVSGHPGQAELADMYGWIKPEIAIPVHGEPRHLKRHAEFARACGVEKSLAPKNGDIIRLAPDGPEVVAEAPVGRLLIDGDQRIYADAETMAERRRMAVNGHLVVALAVDKNGMPLSLPEIIAKGIPAWEDEDLEMSVAEAVEAAIRKLHPRARGDDAKLSEAIRIAARRRVRQETGKKPVTEVILVPVE